MGMGKGKDVVPAVKIALQSREAPDLAGGQRGFAVATMSGTGMDESPWDRWHWPWCLHGSAAGDAVLGGNTEELEQQDWGWLWSGCSLVIPVSRPAAGSHGSPGQLQPSFSSCSPAAAGLAQRKQRGSPRALACAGLEHRGGLCVRGHSWAVLETAAFLPCWGPVFPMLRSCSDSL